MQTLKVRITHRGRTKIMKGKFRREGKKGDELKVRGKDSGTKEKSRKIQFKRPKNKGSAGEEDIILWAGERKSNRKAARDNGSYFKHKGKGGCLQAEE